MLPRERLPTTLKVGDWTEVAGSELRRARGGGMRTVQGHVADRLELAVDALETRKELKASKAWEEEEKRRRGRKRMETHCSQTGS